MKTEGREVNPDQVTPHVVHPGLHQDYDLDFRMRRVDDIAPTLTSPMLSGLVSSVCLLGRPEGLLLPRWKRACGVAAQLPLGQMYQAPHASVVPWRPKETNHLSREGSILMQPSLHLTQRMQLPSSYQMTMRLASPPIGLRPSLHQKLSWPGARRNPQRTGVHTHLLQRSEPKKKRRRVRLLMKQFPEGCWRKTSSPRDMKSLPRITTGSRA